MSQNRAWEFNQKKFDPQILESLAGFNPSDFNDPNKREVWIECAKKFSEMELTVEIVEGIDYEIFVAIKMIMAYSLGDMSRKTEEQRKKIMAQEQQHSKLMQEEQKLNEIHEQNQRKGKLVKQKLEALRIREDEDDSLLDDVNLDDLHG